MFFGREEDIAALSRMIRLEPLVVLYSKSGLGKSSLLSAGIVPEMEQEGKYQAVKIRFQAYSERYDENSLPTQTTLAAVQQQLNESSTFIEDFLPEETSLWYTFKRFQAQQPERELLLLFDQFEELFTYPEAAILDFKKQLAEVLNTQIPQRFRALVEEEVRKLGATEQLSDNFEVTAQLNANQLKLLHTSYQPRVLFAIRSDRMSLLDRIADYLPIVKRAWYELDALSELQAEEAIYNPAYKTGDFRTPVFDYSDDTIDAILDYLTKGHQQKIESFQLQILCQAIERKVEQQGLTLIARSDLGDIQTVYENYYDDQIQELASPEDQLAARRFIEEGLVFEEEERRLSLYEGQIYRQYGISDTLLAQLTDTHLIRREPSMRGGYTYELSHDTLVPAILKAKQERVAVEEEDRQVRLLREERAKRRRANLISTIGLILTVISVMASLWAWQQTVEARENLKQAEIEKNRADSTAEEAEKAKQNALDNLDFANSETTRANQEADAAKQARIEAEANELRALESERIAQSRAERAARLRTTLSADNAYDYLLTTGKELFEKGDYRNALTYFANARFVGTVDTVGNWIEACEIGMVANELYMAGKLREAEKVYEQLTPMNAMAVAFAETQIRYLNISLEAFEEALAGRKVEEVDSLYLKAAVLDILPKEVAYLRNLNLASNDLDKLPVNIHLFKLKQLDISSNNLQSLPESFGQLNQLQTLDLSYNDALSALPESFGHLSQLRSLELSYNSALSALPESFGQLSQLQSLGLNDNDVLSALPESFGQLSQLRSLELSDNDALRALPESFRQLSQLQTLDLSDNDALRALPESFGQLSQLQSLELINNEALRALPKSFGQLSQLQTLYLSSNDALRALPESFGQLSQLRSLDLIDNDALRALPESFGQLSQLQTLNLRYNDALRALPESFGQLSQLQTLNLRYNSALRALPESFGQLSQLQTLYLSNNRTLRALPESFGQLSQLQTLDLSFNRALSALPENFGQLSQLQTLYLHYNDALSALPESFGQLSQLQTLDLGYNDALSALPESFGQLSQLQTLDLSYNDALSALPENFGQLSQLQTLYLHYNDALRALPESFGQLRKLQYLDLRATPKLIKLNVLATFNQTLTVITKNDYAPDDQSTLEENQLIIIVSDNLQQLPESIRTFKNMKRLDVRESKFSPEYIAQLREWLPWCEVVAE